MKLNLSCAWEQFFCWNLKKLIIDPIRARRVWEDTGERGDTDGRIRALEFDGWWVFHPLLLTGVFEKGKEPKSSRNHGCLIGKPVIPMFPWSSCPLGRGFCLLTGSGPILMICLSSSYNTIAPRGFCLNEHTCTEKQYFGKKQFSGKDNR